MTCSSGMNALALFVLWPAPAAAQPLPPSLTSVPAAAQSKPLAPLGAGPKAAGERAHSPDIAPTSKLNFEAEVDATEYAPDTEIRDVFFLRRAQIGLVAKLRRHFDFVLNYNFTGTGTEGM